MKKSLLMTIVFATAATQACDTPTFAPWPKSLEATNPNALSSSLHLSDGGNSPEQTYGSPSAAAQASVSSRLFVSPANATPQYTLEQAAIILGKLAELRSEEQNARQNLEALFHNDITEALAATRKALATTRHKEALAATRKSLAPTRHKEALTAEVLTATEDTKRYSLAVESYVMGHPQLPKNMTQDQYDNYIELFEKTLRKN